MKRLETVKVTDANILFLIVNVLLIAGGIFGMVIAVLIYGSQRVITEGFSLIMIINQVFFILVPTVLFSLIKGYDIRKVFRFNRFSPIAGIIIIFAMFAGQLVAIFLNELVIYPLTLIGKVPTSIIPVPKDIKDLVTGAFVIAVMPAICEEMLNRGILLRAYENRGSIKAVFISAILFGFFHFDIQNLLGATFLGLIIGYAVIKTNSIIAGMLAHFSNNFISLLMSYFFERGQPRQKFITIAPSELLELLLYSIPAALVLLLLFKLFNRVTKTELRPPISSGRRDFTSVISHWPMIISAALYVIFLLVFLVEIIFLNNAGIISY